MKRVKARRLSAASRHKGPPKTVNEYLARVPQPARSTLKKLRAAIRSSVPPKAKEIISYRIPAFEYDGVLVWYAAFADHCSLFPKAAVIESFRAELKDFKISKGTIQFPIDKPLPISLVRRIVKLRVAQSEDRKQR